MIAEERRVRREVTDGKMKFLPGVRDKGKTDFSCSQMNGAGHIINLADRVHMKLIFLKKLVRYGSYG